MACTEQSNYYFAHARWHGVQPEQVKSRHEVLSEYTLTWAVSVMRVLAFKRVENHFEINR